jgi:hypothetical protein
MLQIEVPLSKPDQNKYDPSKLQSLLGKLNFVAQCVKPGRIFISRLLNWLREISDKGSFCIPLDLKIDLLWWNTFLPLYNGVSIMLSEEFKSCITAFAKTSFAYYVRDFGENP